MEDIMGHTMESIMVNTMEIMEISKRFIQYMIDCFKLFFGSAYYEALLYFVLIVCVVLMFLAVLRKKG